MSFSACSIESVTLCEGDKCNPTNFESSYSIGYGSINTLRSGAGFENNFIILNNNKMLIILIIFLSNCPFN